MNDSDTTQADFIEEEVIVERIYAALIDQRLAPGTKLSESELCKAFNVSRMRVRRALLMLANRELVVLLAHKGAFVASPTAKQAEDVFETRLAIETSIVRLVLERANENDLQTLEQHIQEEAAARSVGDRHLAITLSGQFHINLAQVTGNGVLIRLIKDLVTQSSLIIGMFGPVGISNCRDDEHYKLIQAIRASDEESAVQLIQEHIHHIKENINLNSRTVKANDVIGLFQNSNEITKHL